MIPLRAGVRVWLATDMRKGFPSLALQVQEILHRDPLSGHLFCFRGRCGNLLKVIRHDGQGACLFTKRLERGRFISYGLCQSFRTQLPVRSFGDANILMQTIRMGEDAECSRRSLRLLCGDWLPHDDGASEG